MVIVIDIIINDHKCIELIKQVDKSVEDFILAINRFDSEFAVRTHDLCLLLVKCVFIGYDVMGRFGKSCRAVGLIGVRDSLQSHIKMGVGTIYNQCIRKLRLVTHQYGIGKHQPLIHLCGNGVSVCIDNSYLAAQLGIIFLILVYGKIVDIFESLIIDFTRGLTRNIEV